ncbi:glycosyltransferase family 87 protein [Nocardioides terrisoli]|uniref:glycosyltransferase family 87 protein n=1 Tax=Nocardioides terrisoli TaxID=3388267 RepID=UPI00287BB864|nr:glycosyltransferase 87 family protein [Nocardioides marmorisolisilvae]
MSEPPVAPTREDPVAASLSARIGGRYGEHGSPHWWWTPVRVVLACVAVVFALGMVQHAPCMDTHWNSSSVRYSKMCYSDIPYLYTGRGFAEQHWPYAASSRYPAMEYPVGISYLAWFASALTAIEPQGPPENLRAAASVADLWGLPGMASEINENFVITALLLLGLALVAAYFLARTHRGRPWDALPFALSPVLLMTGLINWDLLAVACVAGALFAWSRQRSLLAGIFVGLGTASKLYPLFLLGVFLVLALRAGPDRRDRVRAFALATAGAVGSWVLVNAPAWLGDVSRWTRFWTFNEHRGADLGSLWLVAQQAGHTVDVHALNLASWLVFGGCCLVVLLIGLRAPATPRVAQLGYLVVMAFLIVNKVYSPQYVLWLLPLAVLARPRWRDLLIWQACELFYFAAVWMYLGGWLVAADGSSTPVYSIAIVVRVLGELYLAGRIVRDLWHPEEDPVTSADLDGVALPTVDGVALPTVDGVALPIVDGVALPIVDGVEGGGGVPHAHADLAADGGHLGAGG